MAKFDLVFPSETGLPISKANLNRREFKRVLKEAQLDMEFSLYSLRHTCCSLMLQTGVGVKTVAEKLGHRGIEITLRVYSHVYQPQRDEATAKLAGVLYV
jgi:integrase